MRILWLIFVGFLWGLDFEELKHGMHFSKIEGVFLQEKKMLAFPNPIKTQGLFSLTDGVLIWETQKPLKNSLKINSEGIYMLGKDGQWQQKVQQYDKQFFLSLLRFDFVELQKNFAMTLEGDLEQWRIKLSPKGVLLPKIFKQIFLSGDKFVRSVLLEEANGDKTLITFQNVKTQ